MRNRDKFYFMKKALDQATGAYKKNEVPVGAVVVLNGQVIGRGYNSVIRHSDPTAHAEIMALRKAGKRVGNYRLVDAELYATLEPCPMCYSAMVQARIKKLYFGAYDEKSGFFSACMVEQMQRGYNHNILVEPGVMADKAAKILIDFFKVRRGAGAVERGGLENR